MPDTERTLTAKTMQPEARMIEREPYYEPVGCEIALFEAAYSSQIPVLLKGPTGCGKTRFMEYIAWKLKRPLITVSCLTIIYANLTNDYSLEYTYRVSNSTTPTFLRITALWGGQNGSILFWCC